MNHVTPETSAFTWTGNIDDVCTCSRRNRLKAHTYEVIESPRQLTKGSPWSDAEDRALRRRLIKKKESYNSVTISLGRSASSVSNRRERLLYRRHLMRLGDRQLPDKSIEWRYEAQAALRRLGGKGTLSEICNEIEKVTKSSMTERQKSIDSTGLPQWTCRVNWHLTQQGEFEKTDERAASLADGHSTSVWQLKPDAPAAPEEWPDGKPREQKMKWKNAKERAKGYDGVHMNT